MIDSTVNEVYLWHGNSHSFIEGMCSPVSSYALHLRNSILSGSGGTALRRFCWLLISSGLYFAENSSQANCFCSCSSCGGGGLGPFARACTCRSSVFSMVLCRYLPFPLSLYWYQQSSARKANSFKKLQSRCLPWCHWAPSQSRWHERYTNLPIKPQLHQVIVLSVCLAARASHVRLWFMITLRSTLNFLFSFSVKSVKTSVLKCYRTANHCRTNLLNHSLHWVLNQKHLELCPENKLRERLD